MSPLFWATLELARLEIARDAGDLAGAAREANRVLYTLSGETPWTPEHWRLATALQAIVNESTAPMQRQAVLPLDGQLSMF